MNIDKIQIWISIFCM